MPTAIVVVTCLCFDGIWAFTPHLLHPGRGSLIGYEVSIPLSWTIMYPDLDGSRSGAHSIVVAARYRGMLLAGSGAYFRPPFSYSTMNFRTDPAGDPLATRPATTIISERTLPFGKGTICVLGGGSTSVDDRAARYSLLNFHRQFLRKFQWRRRRRVRVLSDSGKRKAREVNRAAKSPSPPSCLCRLVLHTPTGCSHRA
jgi:hypothetical protein